MELVLLTALGVGGATVVGALIGLLFKNISHKFSDIILAFAAGIMLSASVFGLVIPSLEYGGEWGIVITIVGIFVGAIVLNLLDKTVPHLHKMIGKDIEEHNKTNLGKVGSGDVNGALLIASGIALQNIPEGMVIIAPLLSAGVSKGKTFIIALITGLIEVVGTFIGYFAVSFAKFLLPFALAFAAGTMLYVVSDEMIIETHSHGVESAATYALIFGFGLMLGLDGVLV